MIDYSWVPWFRELVQKIADGGPDDLVEREKAVDWLKEDPPIRKYGDENVDPFSFLYTLVSHLGYQKFMQRLRSAGDAFSIETPPGVSRPHIKPNAINTLFHHAGHGNPSLLWRLFRQAARDAPALDGKVFDDVLDIKNVAMPKLTQALFIVNPRYFLPADGNVPDGALGRGESMALEAWGHQRLDKPSSHAAYEHVMKAVKRCFPECAAYEISTFLDIQESNELLVTNHRCFQLDSRIDGKDCWHEFDQSNSVRTGYAERSDALAEPQRGDIILVSTGSNQGRAVGVVESNGYGSDWTEEGRIAVYWINKRPAELVGQTAEYGLVEASQNSPAYRAFKQTDAYTDTLKMVEALAAKTGKHRTLTPRQPTKPAVPSRPDIALNRILYGPPGTGKTYNAVREAVRIIDGALPENPARQKDRFDELRRREQVAFVTFHQNYAYEDFIEGIRPVLDDSEGALRYELRDGIFKQIAHRAGEDRQRRFVLIIDEINRGNIAKIFGELISLVEGSKRTGREDEAEAVLPYSQQPFGVPDNVYLIGTMNTADRGIALLDVALRRRFEFIEQMPDETLVRQDIDGVDGRALLHALNQRIRENLDRDHQIGHTYLMGVKDVASLGRVFQTQIVPLLQEYFYDDWEKIDSVLSGSPFIVKQGAADTQSFDVLPAGDNRWRQTDSFQAIYRSNRSAADNE